MERGQEDIQRIPNIEWSAKVIHTHLISEFAYLVSQDKGNRVYILLDNRDIIAKNPSTPTFDKMVAKLILNSNSDSPLDLFLYNQFAYFLPILQQRECKYDSGTILPVNMIEPLGSGNHGSVYHGEVLEGHNQLSKVGLRAVRYKIGH